MKFIIRLVQRTPKKIGALITTVFGGGIAAVHTSVPETTEAEIYLKYTLEIILALPAVFGAFASMVKDIKEDVKEVVDEVK